MTDHSDSNHTDTTQRTGALDARVYAVFSAIYEIHLVLEAFGFESDPPAILTIAAALVQSLVDAQLTTGDGAPVTEDMLIQDIREGMRAWCRRIEQSKQAEV